MPVPWSPGDAPLVYTRPSLSPSAETIADMLVEAADYIEANGWVQGKSAGHACTRGTYRPVCMSVAIANVASMLNCQAYGNDRSAFDTCSYAHVALTKYLSIGGWFTGRFDGAIFAWNDTPGREEWEVTEALRTCAKLVRAGDIAVH